MSDPEFPDDYYADRESFLEEFEGEKFMAFDEDANHFECDFCSKGVPYSSKPRVGQYMADRIPHSATRVAREINHYNKLTPLATYCPECTERLLYFPCEGYTEVRMIFDLDTDRVHKNAEITDISPRDGGIPWDPAEISEKITGIPFETHAQGRPDMAMAPENIITFFLSIGTGVDIRELVNYDGTINPKALGQARKEHKKFTQKMSKHADDYTQHKKAFRDHVQGDK